MLFLQLFALLMGICSAGPVKTISLASNDGRCLRVFSEKKAGPWEDHDPIILDGCWEDSDELFLFMDDGTIRPTQYDEFCINAQSGNLYIGDPIIIYGCSAAVNEVFEFVEDAGFLRVTADPTLCIGVDEDFEEGDGLGLRLMHCSEGDEAMTFRVNTFEYIDEFEKGDQGICPYDSWYADPNGRTKAHNWECCENCPNQVCYTDCACECVLVDQCSDFTHRKSCQAQYGCGWDYVSVSCLMLDELLGNITYAPTPVPTDELTPAPTPGQGHTAYEDCVRASCPDTCWDFPVLDGCAEMFDCHHGCYFRELGMDEQICEAICTAKEYDDPMHCSPVVAGETFNLCGGCCFENTGHNRSEPVMHAACQQGCRNYESPAEFGSNVKKILRGVREERGKHPRNGNTDVMTVIQPESAEAI